MHVEMPPCLSHKKSRKGCSRCKIRKVKCDEAYPTCRDCRRHSLFCEYELVQGIAGHRIQNAKCLLNDMSGYQSSEANESQRNRTSALIQGSHATYKLASKVDSFESHEHQLLELRLLHHFISSTSRTLPFVDGQYGDEIWALDIARSSLDHSFLLNAVLAISAQHLAYLNEQSSPTYSAVHPFSLDGGTKSITGSKNPIHSNVIDHTFIDAHRRYLAIAIQGQLSCLSQVQSTNADAVCMTSYLISVQSTALLADGMDSSSSVYLLPVQWLDMANATAMLIREADPFLPETSLVRKITQNVSGRDHRAIRTNSLEHHRLSSLLCWQSAEENINTETQIAYETTLKIIHVLYEEAVNEAHPVLCGRFLLLCQELPQRFVHLVKEQRPRALVILAHLVAGSYQLCPVWWLHRVALHQILGIRSIVPQEWQWALSRPLSMIGMNLPATETGLRPGARPVDP